ncbi:hypothetical protein B1C78_01315 [Thioalkalivibrio denitrificans]|uniref:DUF1249 domain-containing protein n=1 Tax=Thioalkalivibrio denitrificans TaxID=108003 RepID=A0A1V3NUJ7_9GAMM|nr:DUF1249 domain-containing protein [Thioalkalivibrio denitrificans]OOG28623.1 hypothetical protein B1C78_01315 [Thioalkalivibrio denitrificans]
MLIQDKQPAYLEPRPRSFAALMDLYEVNYIRLRRLCPDLAVADGERVSRAPGAMDLHLVVVEQTPYTTTARLTYLFGARGHQRASPDVLVRMYHDARQVEVLGRHCRPLDLEISVEDLPRWRGLDCKWRLNRFLYKWLGYCLRQGHALGRERASTAAEGPGTR